MQLNRFFVTEDRRPALVWRVLGYAILFGVVLTLRGPLASISNPVLTRALPPSILFPASEVVLVAASIAATVGLTYLFRRFVDRRPWAGMGLPSPWRRRGDLAAGFALGAAMILVVFGIEYFPGWIRIIGVKPGFAWAAVVAVLIGRFIHFIGTAVCEEIAYRSYLFQNVGERYRIWIAVLTTGAVFGASHYASAGFTWPFVVGAIVASFFLASMRLVTRAIWFGVGWHLGWDWLEDSLGMIPGYSPLNTERLGPPLWAGTGLAIEGGLLITFVMLAALICLLIGARFVNRGINWNSKLSPDGDICRS
jgi:membrane protease YdiL (CAAX protease family)